MRPVAEPEVSVIGNRARVAIVHDFFVPERGGERVALELARLLPSATVYTSFFDTAAFGDRIDPARVRTWPLQRLLGPTQHFRSFLPLYPAWFSLLDLRDYDLVVGSSVAFTNAVRTRPDAIHVSYVHTPMRYAWDLDTYLAGSSDSRISAAAARAVRPTLQRWDRWAARKPDILVANSATVRERIRRLWKRDAEIIYPPVDVAGILLSTRDDGFLLVAARMLAYRRLDLAVGAATALGRELVVVGDGPESARLRGLAGPSVRFLGHVDRPTLVDLFARCHAYLVPGVEDFGIAPVEAMAAGKPVIAFRGGGATETVVDGRTGLFFDRPEVASLAEAIERLDGLVFTTAVIRSRAQEFDTAVFHARWRELVGRLGVDPSLYLAG
jgi:glycosyltransferase involved in cell wall biosynthesis